MSKHDRIEKAGGTAFPRLTTDAWDGYVGMTLRDYFAGQALQGICGHAIGPAVKSGETSAEAHARWSYAAADAMLAARGAA